MSRVWVSFPKDPSWWSDRPSCTCTAGPAWTSRSTWADDVVRLCAALGIDHPIVFGASFGGFLQHCMPLYSTEPMDLDGVARVVMNVDVMADFFPGEGQTMDLRAGLAAAQCPVLVLAGDMDPVMPVVAGEEIVSSLPSGLARFEALPGKSHLQVGDHTCAPLLREFILGGDP
jgi:pimeloyl-ACP methyl ester carboxylesterase